MSNGKEKEVSVMDNFKKDMEQVIRAGYACAFIRTHEEERTLKTIKEVCDILQQKMYVWDCQGAITLFDDISMSFKKEIDEPSKLFPIFVSDSFKEKTVLAVLDYQFFIQDQPHIIRAIKSSLNILRRDGKIVLFVGPRMPVPEELEKDISTVEFPLPDKFELRKVLDFAIESASSGSPTNALKEITSEMKDKLVDCALGLTAPEAEDLFALALAKNPKLDDSAIKTVLDGKCQILKRDGILEYISTNETMESIGGLDTLKDWLVKRKKAFTDEARAFNLPNPKGVLLVGIPGCGKSLAAKAAASNWQVPLLRLDMGRVFTKFQGESESSARKVIQIAETMSPAVLWIDEIEKGFAGTKSSGELDSGVTARVVQTFLTWMQEKIKPVLVFATANDVSKLPPELLRKGRFDEIFFVDLPNKEERAEIIKIQLKKQKRSLDKIDEIVSITEGYTGAEIEQAIITALYECFDNGKRAITQTDVVKAIKSFVPLAETMKEQIEILREWGKGRARNASAKMEAVQFGKASFLRGINIKKEEEKKEEPTA